VAFTLATASAAPLAAQRRAPSDSLPRAFVVALLGSNSGMGADFDIRAGVLDDSLPRQVVRDAVPLGVSTIREGTTSIAYYPYPVTATIDSLRARFLGAGYKEGPERETRRRGLTSSGIGSSFSMGPIGASNRPVEGFALCGAASMLRVIATTDAQNRTVVTMSLQRNERTYEMVCTEQGAPEMRMYERMMRSPLPALTPPRGMQTSGGGSSGSPEDGGSQHETLYGTVPLPRVKAHYDSLMTAGGWQLVEGTTGATQTLATYEHRAEDGRIWRATLACASLPGSGFVDVLLITRARRER
jgi:hypothetical protein